MIKFNDFMEMIEDDTNVIICECNGAETSVEASYEWRNDECKTTRSLLKYTVWVDKILASKNKEIMIVVKTSTRDDNEWNELWDIADKEKW